MPNLQISDTATKSWKPISAQDARVLWIARELKPERFDFLMNIKNESDWTAICKLQNGEVIIRMAD